MKIIAIDFDGTLVDHRYPAIGQPAPGAAEWIETWLRWDAKVMLWTMRGSGVPFEEAKAYALTLTDEWIGFNENPTQKNWAPDSKKQYAHIYVDDAAFGCPLIQPEGFARPCVDWSLVGPGVLALLQAD